MPGNFYTKSSPILWTSQIQSESALLRMKDCVSYVTFGKTHYAWSCFVFVEIHPPPDAQPPRNPSAIVGFLAANCRGGMEPTDSQGSLPPRSSLVNASFGYGPLLPFHWRRPRILSMRLMRRAQRHSQSALDATRCFIDWKNVLVLNHHTYWWPDYMLIS
jgi:hypothetical protein